MVIVKEENYEPIHSEVWKKLAELEEALYKERKINQQLKRANSKQKNTIRRIVKERDKLRKELNPKKQQYINIQKGAKKR